MPFWDNNFSLTGGKISSSSLSLSFTNATFLLSTALYPLVDWTTQDESTNVNLKKGIIKIAHPQTMNLEVKISYCITNPPTVFRVFDFFPQGLTILNLTLNETSTATIDGVPNQSIAGSQILAFMTGSLNFGIFTNGLLRGTFSNLVINNDVNLIFGDLSNGIRIDTGTMIPTTITQISASSSNYISYPVDNLPLQITPFSIVRSSLPEILLAMDDTILASLPLNGILLNPLTILLEVLTAIGSLLSISSSLLPLLTIIPPSQLPIMPRLYTLITQSQISLGNFCSLKKSKLRLLYLNSTYDDDHSIYSPVHLRLHSSSSFYGFTI